MLSAYIAVAAVVAAKLSERHFGWIACAAVWTPVIIVKKSADNEQLGVFVESVFGLQFFYGLGIGAMRVMWVVDVDWTMNMPHAPRRPRCARWRPLFPASQEVSQMLG